MNSPNPTCPDSDADGASTRRARALRSVLNALGQREPSLLLSRWLFARALGVVYFLAFVSLAVQVEGLIGSKGILPAADFLAAVKQQTGADRYWLLPTLCWLDAGDGFLKFLCWGGALLSLLVVAGVAARLSLALLWLFYLSLSGVGQIFLGYQWDALLLEVGLLAIFYAPGTWLPRRAANEPPPRALVVWLLRWLLFRFMFMSGMVKLLSDDKLWWNLTALTVHYETQPLATWIGWHVHQMPQWFHVASCAVMFLIELILPFFIFAGPRARLMAAAAFTALMLIVAATGNYTFFNMLTITMCLPLVEDGFLRRLLPRTRSSRGNETPSSPEQVSLVTSTATNEPCARPNWMEATNLTALTVFAAVVLLLSGSVLFAQVFGIGVPAPIAKLHGVASPLRSLNSYGLFAVMTPTRPEIIVEGSNDGANWLPYEFKWKAGDLQHAPGFVAPHQPRLDWQMWFAALQDVRSNPWFVNFLAHLLRGTPEVLALMKSNSFPDAPPRFVRATLCEYHFTDSATHDKTGEWWRREVKGMYCPPVSLQK